MRDHPRALMLFAAGFGTRMGDLTRDRPKPLIPVAGSPLIDHALEQIDALMLDRVVVNLHYCGDQIRDHLRDRPDIAFSHEHPDILETGGGLRQALPLLGVDPVYTFNTDAVWAGPNPLTLLRDAWDPATMDALVLLVPLDQTVGHTGTGDFLIDPAGRLTRGKGPVYAGAQILKTDRLSDIAETKFSLNTVWNQMIADRTLFGLIYPGHWADVGRPDGIALAEAMRAHV
ncbi:nucleotidyltransferase family protein [Actibacterium sp. 188UL27-1]|uniref:nucleotidyltransferase family protein n=1 Tax=Actibacterium sp. 188UL27-1 TaxID=2786961 RepID=UPI001959CD78|nr:nucleotidyltransferase family protein [Actibacterium sp. 188UL27-1]MBM7067230.1 nucleotidyltransferase family protein [Actibacterium sp. 188UL27-1]